MLVDPDWQDAANNNAKQGYPWAVWGSKGGRPLGLMDSKKTKEEAERDVTTRNMPTSMAFVSHPRM